MFFGAQIRDLQDGPKWTIYQPCPPLSKTSSSSHRGKLPRISEVLSVSIKMEGLDLDQGWPGYISNFRSEPRSSNHQTTSLLHVGHLHSFLGSIWGQFYFPSIETSWNV
jgi:hypothetical protein